MQLWNFNYENNEMKNERVLLRGNPVRCLKILRKDWYLWSIENIGRNNCCGVHRSIVIWNKASAFSYRRVFLIKELISLCMPSRFRANIPPSCFPPFSLQQLLHVTIPPRSITFNAIIFKIDGNSYGNTTSLSWFNNYYLESRITGDSVITRDWNEYVNSYWCGNW